MLLLKSRIMELRLLREQHNFWSGMFEKALKCVNHPGISCVFVISGRGLVLTLSSEEPGGISGIMEGRPVLPRITLAVPLCPRSARRTGARVSSSETLVGT
jgi:hypothetical protein